MLINIFDTYILAADTYCCLSHRVAPSLMAQSGDLPAPAAEPGVASTAGLQLQGAQISSQLQNLTPTDCYSITIDAIQKSRVTAMVIFHVY